MPSFQEWVSIFVACASVGAFIDFVIGKRGQKRARDWLEAHWIKFSDVKAVNFGREEARRADQFMASAFGDFFSAKRIKSLMVIAAIGLVVGLVLSIVAPVQAFFELESREIFVPLLIALLAASLSISLTHLILKAGHLVITQSARVNFLFYVVLATLQVLSLLVGAEIARRLSYVLFAIVMHLDDVPTVAPAIPGMVWNSVVDPLRDFGADPFRNLFVFGMASPSLLGVIKYAEGFVTYSASVLRLLLALVFVVSYVFRPVQQTVLLLVARIVESDKPIFTMVFGGAGALIKAALDILAKFH